MPGTPDSRTATTPPETLADLGEWELIRRLGTFAPAGQFADDAAVLPLAGDAAPLDAADHATGASRRQLVVNTDVLVDGIHFSDATTAAADVGWRAAAANLSDLAAMGCTEVVGITVGLVAPAATPWLWVEEVYRGLSEALNRHGGVLLGGDCSGGGQRLLAVTAIGQLAADAGAIRRGDGRPGDLLVCTGPHGLSRLGLALLQGAPAGAGGDPGADRAERPTAGKPGDADLQGPTALDPSLRRRAIRAHQRPLPRFDAVQALIRCRPTGLPWRAGGCDSSDGLAAAVAAIAAASGCAGQLDRSALPLDAAMAALPAAEAWCLNGGEDFELVLALDPLWAQALQAALPGASVIGSLRSGAAGTLLWHDGSPMDQGRQQSAGYCHFR